jgi:hypothetical protein
MATRRATLRRHSAARRNPGDAYEAAWKKVGPILKSKLVKLAERLDRAGYKVRKPYLFEDNDSSWWLVVNTAGARSDAGLDVRARLWDVAEQDRDADGYAVGVEFVWYSGATAGEDMNDPTNDLAELVEQADSFDVGVAFNTVVRAFKGHGRAPARPKRAPRQPKATPKRPARRAVRKATPAQRTRRAR